MMPDADLLSATRTLLPAEGEAEHHFYLLVLENGSSSMFHLPLAGVVLIGRAAEADLRLEDTSISRRHARITLADGEAQITDLDSHNGTRVNGQPVPGACQLSSGDVISVGDLTLVFHCGTRRQAGRAFLPARLLQQRLAEEIERVLTAERPLGLALFLLERPADTAATERALLPRLRGIDVAGWLAADQLLVLWPELPAPADEAAAERAELLLEALRPLHPGARAGVAACPADGCDADALLVAARTAAGAAPAGEALRARETVVHLDLGGRAVLLADPAMVRLYDLIKRLARSDLPVLVTGETGAGKENAAFAVHHYSRRSGGPFVALNCAALQDTLMESELFGHERGAFSGATHTKTGLLESAAGGTIFLDEVGELSAGAQSKLLRALEQRRITRVGDVRERPIDIRVVAATNRRLDEEVAAGRFRQDLLFRLSAATVVLPPLRDRPGEITVLAQAFLEDACRKAERPAMAIAPAAMRLLAGYAWPGNVRELRNVMAFLAATVTETPVVEPWHLPERVSGRPPARPVAGPPPEPAGPGAEVTFRPLAEEIRELELRRIQEALRAAGGVRKRAAELIGMPLRTFVLRLKQYGINAPDGDDG